MDDEKTIETKVVDEKDERDKKIEELENEIKNIKEKAIALHKVNKQISQQETSVLNPVAFSQMKELTNELVRAKALPKGIDNGSQALVIMQKGYEMGLKPFESVNSFYMVNGRIQLYGNAVSKYIRKLGYDIDIKEASKEKCVIVVSKGTKKYEKTMTPDDLSTVTKKNPTYREHLEKHLLWKGLKFILDVYLGHESDMGNIYIEGDEVDIDATKSDIGNAKKDLLRNK